MKDEDGKPLTDARLVELAMPHHPWLPPVYKETSGWVNLSMNHLPATWQVTGDQLSASGPLRPDVIPGKLWLELLAAMTKATEQLLATSRCGRAGRDYRSGGREDGRTPILSRTTRDSKAVGVGRYVVGVSVPFRVDQENSQAWTAVAYSARVDHRAMALVGDPQPGSNFADVAKLYTYEKCRIGCALTSWRASSTCCPVLALSELPIDSEVRDHFTLNRQEVFSGALVPIGTGAVIIENDSHPDARRRSTMGHELAHVFGEHKFGTSLVNERGCRLADQTQEDEAGEIAGELLVPFEAARLLARRKATKDAVALQFGVSAELARWRMDATGARLIARRQTAAYQRASGA